MDVGGEADNVKKLYPFVDVIKTSLPSCWNPKEKFPTITLADGNLRARIRGRGAQVPATVRSNHAIPASCGIYYFEVRVVDKGRQGCISIGLSPERASLDHLPGWYEGSFGYYGENGKIFTGSESGAVYGPTFSTGDIIGCGINFVENTCFYTKNGQTIGAACRIVEGKYYPTVGMVTFGETVEANFGQCPFAYDIREEMKEMKYRVQASIIHQPLSAKKSELFRSLISNYLLHHGFCGTAESFHNGVAQVSEKDRRRQAILGVVKSGHFRDAVQQIHQFYPSLFEQRPVLLLTLDCLDFLSAIFNDSHDQASAEHDPEAAETGDDAQFPTTIDESVTCTQPTIKALSCSPKRPRHRPFRRSLSPVANVMQNGCGNSVQSSSSEYFDPPTSVENGFGASDYSTSGIKSSVAEITSQSCEDPPMKDAPTNGCTVFYDASAYIENGANGTDTDNGCLSVDVSDTNGNSIETYGAKDTRYTLFVARGRELYQTLMHLKKEKHHDDVVLLSKCNGMLHDAFGAMAGLKACIVSGVAHLENEQRERIVLELNSAMLAEEDCSGRSVLESMYGHAQRLRTEMASHGLGAAAFADPNDVFNNVLYQ